MKNLVTCLVLFFSISLLVACAPKTEEEQIAAINKLIAPDGHLTKTHLYIHWPAVYTKPQRNDPGGKEIVPVITLKIPMEYLGQSVLDGPPKSSKIDYMKRIIGRTLRTLDNHEISYLRLGLLPGAKPYVPQFPAKTETEELKKRRIAHNNSAYSVSIDKNTSYTLPIDLRKPKGPNKEYYYEKPPSVSCVVTTCIAAFDVKWRYASIGVTEEMKKEGNQKKIPRKALTKRLEKFSDNNVEEPHIEEHKELADWRKKVDPTKTLLNSFVLPEDSPEVRGIFSGK